MPRTTFGDHYRGNVTQGRFGLAKTIWGKTLDSIFIWMDPLTCILAYSAVFRRDIFQNLFSAWSVRDLQRFKCLNSNIGLSYTWSISFFEVPNPTGTASTPFPGSKLRCNFSFFFFPVCFLYDFVSDNFLPCPLLMYISLCHYNLFFYWI